MKTKHRNLLVYFLIGFVVYHFFSFSHLYLFSSPNPSLPNCALQAKRTVSKIPTDCFYYGKEIQGESRIRSVSLNDNSTARTCQVSCQNEVECKWFTWLVVLKLCFLYRSKGLMSGNTAAVTGSETCTENESALLQSNEMYL